MNKKQRKSRRTKYRLIGFKAHPTTDADLIAWWESIRDGERSDTIRSLLRAALGYQQFIPQTNQLDAIQDELAWVRNALNDLPDYVGRVMHQVAMMNPLPREPTSENGNHQRQASAPMMSDESARRREQRMKKARW